MHAWRQFHLLYPLDDLHRIYRPAAMIASSLRGSFTEKLDFISPKPRATPRRNLRPVEVIRTPKE